MFEHDFVDLPELDAEIVDGVGRIYTTPKGDRYPSVTTIIGHGTDTSWLEEWRARVGDREADRIVGVASRRGTAVHDMAEQYLRNNKDYAKGVMPVNVATFRQIKPFLDKNISKIYGLEVPLYSDKLRAAGRVDCASVWNGIDSVVDFKTSKRVKHREDIHTYFIQEAAYAMMFYEHTGIFLRQLVTVIAVDDGQPAVFIENARDWIEKFIEVRNKVSI